MASTGLPAVTIEATAKPTRMSLMGILLAMPILTLVPGAAGALLGLHTVSVVRDAQQEKKEVAPPAVNPVYSGTMVVKELPSIVTNLSEPDRAMIRLQAAILFDRKTVPNADVLASQIGDDLLAFLATISELQIEGASGLEHLREDLNDRAKVRSEGHVLELVIETLVVQ